MDAPSEFIQFMFRFDLPRQALKRDEGTIRIVKYQAVEIQYSFLLCVSIVHQDL
jgi:hypothetical protein